MPIYDYKCSNCGKVFEAFNWINSSNTEVCECKGIAFKMEVYKLQILEKDKWKETGKNNVDQGIPFGEVPGDDDYVDKSGRVPEEPGYLGPLP